MRLGSEPLRWMQGSTSLDEGSEVSTVTYNDVKDAVPADAAFVIRRVKDGNRPDIKCDVLALD